MRSDACRAAALAAVALCAAPAGAQIVSGRVVERPESGTPPGAARRPLVGVAVRLLRATPGDTAAPADTTPLASAATAADGGFVLPAPGPGVYRVRLGAAVYGPVLTLATADTTTEDEYPVAMDYGGVFAEAGVDSAARLRPGDVVSRIRYPATLQRRNVQGAAVARMVVDTAGAIEPGTFVLALATHPEFGEALRAALAGARYRPAVRSGQRVRQLVEVPARFLLAAGPGGAPRRPGTGPVNEIVVTGFSR